MHYGLSGIAALLSFNSTLLLAVPISVSEIQYNPLTDSDYEFIELVNPGATPFNLTGCRFTSGIDFTFSTVMLAPGGRVVVARDLARFTSRYPGVTALGPYKKKLSDDGDTVTLVSALGTELVRVKYGTSGNWPSRANGLGSSLEVIDPNGNLDDPDNWRSSTEYHGSPGKAGIGAVRTVVINEVMAHTDPPFEDAVELKNLTDQPVDIGGAYLSNSRLKPMKYRLPRPWVIPARGYRVVYEHDFNSAAQGSDAFTFNSAHGDEVVLLASDANGQPTLWLDATSFAASANGVSFGRYPDGTGPLVVMARQTLGTDLTIEFPPNFLSEFVQGKGASNSLPQVGPLVFHRIQYEPAPGQDEFLELKNIAPQTVLLYDPSHPTNTWRLGNGVGFSFPTGQQLAPGETALLVRTNPAAFRTKYGLQPSLQIFGPFTNALSNSGERLELFRPDEPQGPDRPDAGFVPYLLIEEVDYKPGPPWPADAAGTGAYLERIDSSRYGNDPANWRAAGALQTPLNLQAEWITPSALRLTVIGPRVVPLRLESSPAPTGAAWTSVAELGIGADPYVYESPAGETARFFRVYR